MQPRLCRATHAQSMLEVLNTPIIFYTIDNLLSQRFKPVYVACDREDQERLEMLFATRYSPSLISFIECMEARTSGDILRTVAETLGKDRPRRQFRRDARLL